MENKHLQPKKVGRPKAEARGKAIFIPAPLVDVVETLLAAHRVKHPKIGTQQEVAK